jgi:hypothetical protein
MSIRDFASGAREGSFESANYALILSDVLLHALTSLPRPLADLAKQSLYGVALIPETESNLLRPTILSGQGLAGGVATMLRAMDIPGVADILVFLFGAQTPWLSEVRLMGVPPLEPHLSPGDTISAALRGTAGCGVRWSNNFGFLTAGHVAPVNAQVFHGKNAVGTTLYSNDPAGQGLKVADDVAVVQLTSSFYQGIPGLGKAGPGDQVTIQNPGAKTYAQIQGYATYFNSPKANGTYGELYLTHGQVTQAGHSGAAVLNSAGNLIGHVVGASPGVFSYIQDIHYQLTIIDSQPGFSGIALS